jgi:cell division protein FtsB
MGKGYRAQNNISKRFAIAFLSLALVYLLFHLFASERSIPNLFTLSAQQIELEQKIVLLNSEKEQLQIHVTKLQPETLDQDLVEEYAIRMLGHNTNGGMIIIQDQNS